MSYELMMATKWEAERRIRNLFDRRYGHFLKCTACGQHNAQQVDNAVARCVQCDTVGSCREAGYTAPPEWIK